MQSCKGYGKSSGSARFARYHGPTDKHPGVGNPVRHSYPDFTTAVDSSDRRAAALYPDVYASHRYDASQQFGENVRASGGTGIVYTSLRLQSGINVVAFRTHNITDIVQEDHFEITISATDRTINIRRLSR